MAHGEAQRPYLDRQIVSRKAFLATVPVLTAGILGCAQPNNNRTPDKPAPISAPKPATVGPPASEPTVPTSRPNLLASTSPTRARDTAPITSGEVYRGTLPFMDNKPLLSDQDFKEIGDAMNMSGYPLFQMLAGHLQTLRTTTKNPDEFPTWISPQSTPLPITVDTVGHVSSASVTLRRVPDTDIVAQYIHNNIRFPFRDMKEIDIGINLALSPTVTAQGPISEAFYLLKELISHMVHMRLADDYFKVLQNRGTIVTDTKGAPIADQDLLKRVGIQAFFQELGSPERPDVTSYRIVDGFPILLLGNAVLSLASQGKIPPSATGGYATFYAGAQQLEAPEAKPVRDYMGKFIDDWVRSKKMLPPVDGLQYHYRTPSQ